MEKMMGKMRKGGDLGSLMPPVPGADGAAKPVRPRSSSKRRKKSRR
jgi:hypothetical protein